MRQLRNEITCLHCWTKFKPEEALWQSEHRDLLGDPLLGDNAQLRFLPVRFDLSGNALDAKGQPCRELACPRCHLSMPRSLLEREPLFISILGTPSCGKSYYLGALATSLRRELPLRFQLTFEDADMVGNQSLVRYEERLFMNETPDDCIALADLIPKTQLHGDLYHTVRYGEQTVTYPTPFSFLLGPLASHPNHGKTADLHRVLGLYDNAGEHFLPGQDSFLAPGTRHLAESSFLLFLFDPTQDLRWHNALKQTSPQSTMPRTQHAGRQEGVLREAASRVSKLVSMADGGHHDRPLIVVLSKADVWDKMLADDAWEPPFVSCNHGLAALDMKRVLRNSAQLRQLVLKHIPELVIAAEAFCKDVYYTAVSALGHGARFDEKGRGFVRPRDIRPQGVAVPFLLGLALTTKGLVAKTAIADSTRPAAPRDSTRPAAPRERKPAT